MIRGVEARNAGRGGSSCVRGKAAINALGAAALVFIASGTQLTAETDAASVFDDLDAAEISITLAFHHRMARHLAENCAHLAWNDRRYRIFVHDAEEHLTALGEHPPRWLRLRRVSSDFAPHEEAFLAQLGITGTVTWPTLCSAVANQIAQGATIGRLLDVTR